MNQYAICPFVQHSNFQFDEESCFNWFSNECPFRSVFCHISDWSETDWSQSENWDWSQLLERGHGRTSLKFILKTHLNEVSLYPGPHSRDLLRSLPVPSGKTPTGGFRRKPTSSIALITHLKIIIMIRHF